MRRLSRGLVGFAVMVSLLGLFTFSGPVAAGRDDAGHDWIAVISSGSERPFTDTGTYGWAIMHVNDDGQSMTWTLWINAINNPVAAHIHLGGVGVNGPVVVPMYAGKDVGPFSGVMSSGVMTAKDLDGPLKGMTMDDLFTSIRTGNAYVNVHTAKNPGGEARGQIYSSEIQRLGNG